jgi:hypothetical protein
MNGFTVYLVVGRWAKPGVAIDGNVLRIVLGFIAIGFMLTDLEVFMGEILDVLEEKTNG